MGLTASIALLGIGGGIAASKMMQPKQGIQSPTPLPQPPSQVAAADTAQQNVQKRTAGLTQTVFTGPLGIQDQANVAKKILLGE